MGHSAIFFRLSGVWMAVLAVLLCGAAALAQPPAAEQARVLHLEKSLLAPCCWNEAVATHRSEVALTMRAEIARMVGEGKTDQQVLDYYKQQYGARILVEPEGSRWWWMHVIPVIVIVLAVLGLVLFIRRLSRPVPA
ncbi:MAG: cytochrome c-type biogenesis protein CcmH [Acidobacteriales bacterium]|nr:cytochrome c-type biogenesis protein CcmH [Terriglobales bacterium]